MAFVPSGTGGHGASYPPCAGFLRLEPANLIMTALKKGEDDDSIALRFFEAEGRAAIRAHVQLFRPIQRAWKTNLIEDEPEVVPVTAHGTVELDVQPWEIVTLKLAV